MISEAKEPWLVPESDGTSANISLFFFLFLLCEYLNVDPKSKWISQGQWGFLLASK